MALSALSTSIWSFLLEIIKNLILMSVCIFSFSKTAPSRFKGRFLSLFICDRGFIIRCDFDLFFTTDSSVENRFVTDEKLLKYHVVIFERSADSATWYQSGAGLRLAEKKDYYIHIKKFHFIFYSMACHWHDNFLKSTE